MFFCLINLYFYWCLLVHFLPKSVTLTYLSFILLYHDRQVDSRGIYSFASLVLPMAIWVLYNWLCYGKTFALGTN